MLVKSSDVRLKSVYTRAIEVGFTPEIGKQILSQIGSFPNVEQFMGWKKQLTGKMAYIVERVGANNYRKMRDIVAGL